MHRQELRERKVKSTDLVNFLEAQGFSFRLNICDDSIECNGERLSDVARAGIRTRLRDAGLGKYLAAAEDAVLAHAARQPFHPVHSYLEGLQWEGDWQISNLANHFTDTHTIFGMFLRKWLIGAVARAYTGGQNAMLVLDGPQGVGKSAFAQWLCPLPGLFVDGGISPDEKDCNLLAIRTWIWEVSELGATTRRTDVEALKGFLSRVLHPEAALWALRDREAHAGFLHRHGEQLGGALLRPDRKPALLGHHGECD